MPWGIAKIKKAQKTTRGCNKITTSIESWFLLHSTLKNISYKGKYS
jgi:hypothetical protein